MNHSKSLLNSLEGNEVIHVRLPYWIGVSTFPGKLNLPLLSTEAPKGPLLPIDSGLKRLD